AHRPRWTPPAATCQGAPRRNPSSRMAIDHAHRRPPGRTGMSDPFALTTGAPRYFLSRLNPLAKLAAVLPFMLWLLLVRDVWTPFLFLILAMVTILIGARLSWRTLLLLVAGLPA